MSDRAKLIRVDSIFQDKSGQLWAKPSGGPFCGLDDPNGTTCAMPGCTWADGPCLQVHGQPFYTASSGDTPEGGA